VLPRSHGLTGVDCFGLSTRTDLELFESELSLYSFPGCDFLEPEGDVLV
jgi:hypothetical protein